MQTRSKTWAATLLLATFIAGATVGAGARALWVRKAQPVRGPERFLGQLTQELKLTPRQHDSVGAIIWRHWTQTNALWDTVKPRFDAIRSDMDSEVVRLLNADQVQGYRDHVTRYRRLQAQERQNSGHRQ
jgi:hypothetical protein